MAIDEALLPVIAADDPRTIGPLLLMLNDAAEDDGLWSIVHYVEHFDDAAYVENYLRCLPDLVISSTRWASILMMRILNSDAARSELVRGLQGAPPDARRTAAMLCEGINDQDLSFLSKTTAVLVAARHSG